ncbi:MAG TPA: chemotaxis protein CheW [Xanthomonadales bacterium]|nr:chemotaxis protein CheW [Xanthomonadales bacterium]
MADGKDKSTSSNIAFAKLLEYEERSESFAPGQGQGRGPSGEWSGVTFRMGEARLACDNERIQEILSFPQSTPVPGSKPWILGLANVRGALLTIVDLGWFVTGKRSSITVRSRLLSSQLQKAPVGLLIDEVYGQRHFLDQDAMDAEVEEDSPLSGLISKKHQVGSETWHELDLDQLFTSQEFLNGAAD